MFRTPDGISQQRTRWGMGNFFLTFFVCKYVWNKIKWSLNLLVMRWIIYMKVWTLEGQGQPIFSSSNLVTYFSNVTRDLACILQINNIDHFCVGARETFESSSKIITISNIQEFLQQCLCICQFYMQIGK